MTVFDDHSATAVADGCPYRHQAVDLADPALYSGRDPHAVWTALRRHDPVSRHVLDGTPYWSVTRYADADRVLRDHATFTSQRGTLLYLLGRGDPAGGHQMAATDPPRHTALREPLQRALAVKPTLARREQIRQVVVDLLAPLADGGEYDLAAAMSRLPMAVAGVLMGLPPEDWPRLIELTTASVAPEDPRLHQGRDLQSVLNASHRELFAYFHDVVRHRRTQPGDDLVSLLLAMEVDGRRLTVGDVTSNCYSLLLGANVTTAQVPVSTLAELMGTPALDDWADHPELLQSGVDEALRWATPTTHFIRYATKDVTLRDRRIEEGDAVAVWLGSANRDEEVFKDPFTFDVRRKPNKHLAFGIGPHYCVGHTVAKVTLRLLFAELFSRFTDLAPSGPGERLYSNTIYGWTSMPITAKLRSRRRPAAY
ncbi:cytochrome P450 [Streptomyces tendae]|uniref:Cytochrome P450 n=1 Tax=Streptomyces tendae TaxID=1932 RepID=A0ABX6A0H6_STRTE|nr:cytochrome P450 [Streptomyces tendae]QER90440.1 cytochrome P450 [Streptomyces tendae]